MVSFKKFLRQIRRFFRNEIPKFFKKDVKVFFERDVRRFLTSKKFLLGLEITSLIVGVGALCITLAAPIEVSFLLGDVLQGTSFFMPTLGEYSVVETSAVLIPKMSKIFTVSSSFFTLGSELPPERVRFSRPLIGPGVAKRYNATPGEMYNAQKERENSETMTLATVGEVENFWGESPEIVETEGQMWIAESDISDAEAMERTMAILERLKMEGKTTQRPGTGGVTTLPEEAVILAIVVSLANGFVPNLFEFLKENERRIHHEAGEIVDVEDHLSYHGGMSLLDDLIGIASVGNHEIYRGTVADRFIFLGSTYQEFVTFFSNLLIGITSNGRSSSPLNFWDSADI